MRISGPASQSKKLDMIHRCPRLKIQHCALFIVVGVLGALNLTGCAQDDGVKQYTVEKLSSGVKPESQQERPQGTVNVPPAWFLKMTGPADTVLKQIVAFSKIVKTMRFDDAGTPQMDLPEGWTVSDGPPPRHQTVKIADTDPPLELTVSSLPGPESAFDQYLLSNIDRWRGQLGLEPYDSQKWITESRENGELTVLPLESRVVALVSLQGEIPEKGASRILGAIILSAPEQGEQRQSGNSGPASAKEMAGKPPFEFTLPEGWAPSAGNAMRLASFEAKKEEGAADVSVTRFPGGGDVLSNVNRWRKEVKLDDLTEEQLNSERQEMKISGMNGVYVEATGPEEATLAAIVPDGDSKWFFKMRGPKDVVTGEKDRFLEFLKSVKFQK